MVDRRQFLSATIAPTLALVLRDAAAADAREFYARIDNAICAAIHYLNARQDADGAWRSELYGPLKEGPALTSLIAATLTPIRDRGDCRAAWAKGARYLSDLVSKSDDSQMARPDLAYPVYVAAGAVIALSEQPNLCDSRDRGLEKLRALQLTEQYGWQPSDLAYGGWSYASTGLVRGNGSPATPLAVPNLSATVYALDALRAAGVSSCDPSFHKARRFVERCQNWPQSEEQLDPRFDDGGFYFILEDAQRNKAGEVGSNALGRPRFASYGSATADGLRALMACGVPEIHPRCRAACGWLTRNFSAVQHPGDYTRDREHLRPSLYYYYCASATRSLAHRADPPTNLQEIAAALLWRQRQDGSWSNSAVDVREDDPLVATPLAVQSLLHFQNA